MTPFRSEKNSNWEGAYRVPCVLRWPGHIPSGLVSNDICSHLDMLPTLLALAGNPDVKERLLHGYQANGHRYSVHLDGYNLLPFLTEEGVRSPRKEFFYFSDDGDLTALRFDNWKVVFMEQRQPGTLRIWAEPFVQLRVPKIFNLRTDPYERADVTSNTYYDWVLDHAFILYPLQPVVRDFLSTFADYPPRQRAASFTVNQVMEKLEANAGSSR
jgi:arylsulfatase